MRNYAEIEFLQPGPNLALQRLAYPVGKAAAFAVPLDFLFARKFLLGE